VDAGDQSIGAIRVALATSLGIALSQLLAASASNSAAVLALAVQGIVASSSLVLVFAHAARRATRAAANEALGGAHEADFWSHGATLFLFSIGAGALVTEGLHRAFAPAAILEPQFAYGACALAIVLSALALWTALDAWHERRSLAPPASDRDPALSTATLLSLAALFSAVIALAGVSAADLMAIAWADGAASIAIGLVMAAVAAMTSLDIRRSLVAADRAVAATRSEGQPVTPASGPEATSPPAVAEARAAPDAIAPDLPAVTAPPLSTTPASTAAPKQHPGTAKGKGRRRH